jgi:hypothetical protein
MRARCKATSVQASLAFAIWVPGDPEGPQRRLGAAAVRGKRPTDVGYPDERRVSLMRAPTLGTVQLKIS